MGREIILLGVGGFFGLGATITAFAAPTYLPNMLPWAIYWLFWGGLALMALMVVDALLLLVCRAEVWASRPFFSIWVYCYIRPESFINFHRQPLRT